LTRKLKIYWWHDFNKIFSYLFKSLLPTTVKLLIQNRLWNYFKNEEKKVVEFSLLAFNFSTLSQVHQQNAFKSVIIIKWDILILITLLVILNKIRGISSGQLKGHLHVQFCNAFLHCVFYSPLAWMGSRKRIWRLLFVSEECGKLTVKLDV